MQLCNDFYENIQLFKQAFERDDLFVLKTITNDNDPTLNVAIALNNCMVSSPTVNRDIIKPLTKMPPYTDVQSVVNSGVFVSRTAISAG